MKKSCFSGVAKSLEMLLKKGVETNVFSGAAVGVYKHTAKGEENLVIHHGNTSYGPGASLVNENTLFDLASLTKPLCTVPVILHLMQTKKISWESQIDALVGTKTPLFFKNIKITSLLSHSSGIKAYKPFYLNFQPEQKAGNRERLFTFIFDEKPVYPEGEKCIYSDLGYIILGEVIEKLTGQRLDNIYREKVTGPLGLEKQVLFRPVNKYGKKENGQIAATQNCPWRKRVLQGEVDDEHCWLMNGVSGHAGLFGTINGVLNLTKNILNQWKGRENHPSYSNELLRKALTRPYKNQTWCMGFDTPSPSGSSSGRYLSKESVGHLGFTGTSFWIDPEKDMTVVLLTNRVHPTRNNGKIKQFRPLLHDTLFEGLQGK